MASFDQMLQTNVIVNHTGSVKWLPPGLFQTTCSVDIAYFPYDEQKCSIKFGTWTYQENLVSLFDLWNTLLLFNLIYCKMYNQLRQQCSTGDLSLKLTPQSVQRRKKRHRSGTHCTSKITLIFTV